MLRKAAEREFAVVEKPRGGKGTMEAHILLTEAEFGGMGRMFNHVTLPPGSEVGYHAHNGDSEIYYILKGQGLYNNNGEIVSVGPGDVTICPSGEKHGIENNTSEPLEFIALILMA